MVTLPATEFIDNAHIQNPCTRVQFNAEPVPQRLDARHRQGDLAAPRRAAARAPSTSAQTAANACCPTSSPTSTVSSTSTLVGFIDARNARIRTTFQNVPDAPVTKFTINLKGGKQGLLVNSTDLCAKVRRAKLALTAQNGLQQNTEPVVKTSCKKKGKGKKPQKRG